MSLDPPRSRFLDNVLLFGRALRMAGLKISLDQTMSFARALDWVDIGSRDQVFHAARSFLVNRREDLSLFAAVFERFWLQGAEAGGARKMPIPPRHDWTKNRRFRVSLLAAAARESDPEIEVSDRAATYSDQEVLQRKDFAAMTPEELDAIRRLIRDLEWKVSLRRTRRPVADSRGAGIDLRRMLREAARHGGTPLVLRRMSRKVKRRPMVLLADISGSMERYSRLMLQFFHSATHGLGEVESFVFGTRLTRITPQLRIRNIDRALDEASEAIADWSGGTRIGNSLAVFNREWGRRVLRRGAIVLVVSDGWERGGVEILRREMRHLHHRCHRLIWLNPHLGQPGYEPLVEGMAAALPFVDDFLAIHNLSSLGELATHLSRLPSRRSGLPAIRRRARGGRQEAAG